MIKSLGRTALEMGADADLRIAECDLVKDRSCAKPDYSTTK